MGFNSAFKGLIKQRYNFTFTFTFTLIYTVQYASKATLSQIAMRVPKIRRATCV